MISMILFKFGLLGCLMRVVIRRNRDIVSIVLVVLLLLRLLLILHLNYRAE